MMNFKAVSWTAGALCLLLASHSWAAVADGANAAPVAKAKVKAKAKPVAAAEPVEEPLTDEQLAIAPRVNAGDARCEFKQTVKVSAHPTKPGRFQLQFGKMIYNMTPEPTSTGAVVLKDKLAGVEWLQIPTKSMLMNTRLGQRMVDGCQHPEQVAYESNPAPAATTEGFGIAPDSGKAN